MHCVALILRATKLPGFFLKSSSCALRLGDPASDLGARGKDFILSPVRLCGLRVRWDPFQNTSNGKKRRVESLIVEAS